MKSRLYCSDIIAYHRMKNYKPESEVKSKTKPMRNFKFDPGFTIDSTLQRSLVDLWLGSVNRNISFSKL